MELVATPENPIPDGAVCSQIITADGFKLRVMTARVSNSRGTVVVLGGRADFMERYFETMRDFMTRGFSVASVDLRGQGGSQRLTKNPLRGHINGFDHYDEDIRCFMMQVVLPDCPPPYYVVAHSTGGNIILRSLRTRTWFKKCVLVSPLLGLHYGAWPLPPRAHTHISDDHAGIGLGLSSRTAAHAIGTQGLQRQSVIPRPAPLEPRQHHS